MFCGLECVNVAVFTSYSLQFLREECYTGSSIWNVIQGHPFGMLYRVIRLECQKSKTLYTRKYANLLLVNSTYMCRRVWSLCHSTLLLNMSNIAHMAQIKPRFHIAPRGTQHLWKWFAEGLLQSPSVGQPEFVVFVCTLSTWHRPIQKNLEELGQGY